jgi:hypothetical protein
MLSAVSTARPMPVPDASWHVALLRINAYTRHKQRATPALYPADRRRDKE